MKNLKKVFGLLSVLFVITGGGIFTACSDDDDTSEEGTSYSISVDEESVTLAPGGTKKLTVTTNGTFTAASDNSKVTAKASNSEKTLTLTADDSLTELATAKVTLKLNEDDSKTATVVVTVDPEAEVVEETYELALSLDDEVAAKAAKIVVNYGADSGTYEDTEAVYTAGEKTATAALKLSLANDYGWVNNITVKVYDSSDELIATEIDSNNFDVNVSGKNIAITAYVSGTMTVKFSVPAEAGATSIKLHYYPSMNDAATESDGEILTENIVENAATFTLSKDYANSGNYYNGIVTLYKDSEDITGNVTSLASDDSTFGGTCEKSWWAYEADKVTVVTISYSSENWKELVSKDAYSLTGNPAFVISKDDIKGYTFTALKIEVSGVAAATEWITMTSGEAWSGQLSLTKGSEADDGTYTWTGTAAAENLASYASNGIGLAGTANDSVKVVIYYLGDFDEEAHNAVAETAVKTIVDAQTFDFSTASWDNYIEVAGKSLFENLVITQIDVSLVPAETLSSGKIAVGVENVWKEDLTWPSEDETAFTASLTSSDIISAIQESGMTIGGDYTGSATVIVKVTYEVSE